MIIPHRDLRVTINQGADFVRDYELLDSGVPIDLTGSMFSCAFTRNFSEAALFAGNGSVLDGPSGKFRLHVPAATTAAVEPNTLIDQLTNVGDVVQDGLRDQYELLQFDVFITFGAAAGATYQNLTLCPIFGTACFYPSAQA